MLAESFELVYTHLPFLQVGTAELKGIFHGIVGPAHFGRAVGGPNAKVVFSFPSFNFWAPESGPPPTATRASSCDRTKSKPCMDLYFFEIVNTWRKILKSELYLFFLVESFFVQPSISGLKIPNLAAASRSGFGGWIERGEYEVIEIISGIITYIT